MSLEKQCAEIHVKHGNYNPFNSSWDLSMSYTPDGNLCYDNSGKRLSQKDMEEIVEVFSC